MAIDWLAFSVIGIFGLFLLVGFSVMVKNLYFEWKVYRSKIKAAWLKRFSSSR